MRYGIPYMQHFELCLLPCCVGMHSKAKVIGLSVHIIMCTYVVVVYYFSS